MSHRAQQIIDAVVSSIADQAPSGHKVFAHRRESLAEDQDELPAHIVDYDPDQAPDPDGASNMAFIDSLLTVTVTHVAHESEEKPLQTLLLEMRSDVHAALMADRTLGLAFVVDTRYGGAEAPEFDVSGETLVGTLTSSWDVHYRMTITDPEN